MTAATALVVTMFPPKARAEDLGVAWVAAPVRFPVAPETASPIHPFLPPGPEATGAVTVGPGRAAALWLDPLDVVRVTRQRPGKLAFQRVLGDGRARATADEPGVPIDERSWYLQQPPGRGDLWLIAADAPTPIAVERPVVRQARLLWNESESRMLAWIDDDDSAGEPPPMPLAPGSAELRLRLVAEREIGARLVAGRPALARHVAAWRKASALLHQWAIRPLVEQHFFVSELPMDGSGAVTLGDDDTPAHPFRRGRPQTTKLVVRGPGVLRVDVRGLVVRDRPRGIAVRIARNGVTLASRAVDATAAVAPDDVVPPPAIPAKRPLVTGDGEAVTALARASIAVPDGEHAFDVGVGWDGPGPGDPLLVRAVFATRRPRLADAVGVARLSEVARADPETARLLDGGLPSFAWSTMSPALAGWRALTQARRGDDPRTVLSVGPLPPEVLPALADLFPEATLLARLRSPAVGALDIAFRARFFDPGVVEAYRAAWRSGAWSLVPPGGAEDPERPTASTWLDASPVEPTFPGLPPPPRDQAALFRLPLGAARRVMAPASAFDPSRPAILPVYVATPAGAPGPFVLTVDGVRYGALGFRAVERLEVAVAPGEHEVKLDAPTGTTAWVGLPLLGAAGEPAALRRYWPTGGRARWVLPQPRVPGAIRVELRAPAGANVPIPVTIRADTGERRTVVVTPGPADAAAMPVDAPGPVTGAITLVFHPPPGAEAVWIEAATPVYASLAVRREGDPAATGEPRPRPPRNERDALARVAVLSRALLDRPDDAAALVERGHLLLDLEQGDLARQDLIRLARLPAHRLGAAETELADRLDAYTAPTHVRLPDGGGPIPLSPALLVVREDLDALVPAALAARANGAAAALASLDGAGPAVTWARARLLEDAGRPADAGLLLVGLSPHPAAALEAARALLRALEGPRTPPPGTAAVAYGVASRLRQETDHPAVRRALVVSGALSRWDQLEGAEASAGLERLYIGDDATTLAAVRQALLPTPWPAASAHTLPPGVGAALDVTLSSPARLSAQAFCIETRAAERDAACRVTIRLDGRELARVRLEPGKPQLVPAEAVTAGRHRLEAALSESSTGVLASVRFLADRALPGTGPPEPAGHPIAIEKPQRFLAADARRPVVLTVLGPATLRVEARAVVAGGTPGSIDIEARSRDGALRQALPLDPALDEGARGDAERRLRVNRESEAYVVLPAAAPYRVTLRPDRGTALVRLALREDAGGTPPRIPPPFWEGAAAAATLPWPGLAPSLRPLEADVYCPRPPRGGGTLSLAVVAGTEPLGEQDQVGAFHGILQVSPRWRARIGDDLFVGVAPVVRFHDDSDVVAGATIDAFHQRLPGSFRLLVTGAAYTQRYAGASAYSIYGAARLDRPFPLGGAFTLLPSLGARAAHLSLDRATVVTTGDPVDADVYNDYTRTRPVTLSPRLALSAWPLQDLIATLSLAASTYRDQQSIDHVSAGADGYALLPVLGETFLHLGYGASYRFANADRLEAFLRHDLTAELEWSLWTGDEGRFVLFAGDTSYFGAGTRHVVSVGLRYDWTGGRGLRDMLPTASFFDELVERRMYLP